MSVKDYSHLLRVGKQETPDEYYIRAEYSRAYDYVCRFSKTVDDLAITDSTIRKLNIEEVNIIKEIVTNAESDPMDLMYRFCCPFCGKHELIEKGKKPKSCESPECPKAYSAATTRKSSNQPHSLNKKSKKSVSKWVKVDNITRWCIALLNDWVLDPEDMEARARSIEALNATRSSQQPRKAGRKAA